MNEYNRWQSAIAKPRAKRIAKMRKAGASWKEIAKLLNISRQRAQQIHERNAK